MSSKNSLFAFNNVIIIHLSCLSRHITKNKSSGSRTDLYMNPICTQTRLDTKIYRYRFNRFYMPHKKNAGMQYTVIRSNWGKVCIFKRCVAYKGVYIQKVCKIGKGVYIQKVYSTERCVYSKGV